MKRCLKGTAPNFLEQYKIDNPIAEWNQFKNECQNGYEEVQKKLREDQGNLCCYCEIETKHGFGIGNDDFRVEHFHPKSDKSDPNCNWGLDWQNMLGCCHGGQERYVIDTNNRFIHNHAERHSDVLKENSIWDDEILNPLEIPAFPILFQAHRNDGGLSVHESNCHESGISIEKANNCLAPKKINLNSKNLKILRKAVMNSLNEQIEAGLLQGLSIEEAIINVTKAQLRKNAKGHWPSFFTTIRSFLGKKAEEHLQEIDYIG